MINIENLDFSYKQISVLININVQINRNEFVGIIGPNGGGKTTFLKMIAGFIKPSKGIITIDQEPPENKRNQIGYVPQLRHFDQLFPLSVKELVLMGCLNELTFWGKYPKHCMDKALEALENVALLDVQDKPFGKLSGGQMQRALIARAIMGSPLLLLLDEPTANVDPYAEEKIYDVLLKLRKKMTILVVTHELPGIIKHVDRVFCIQNKLTELDKEHVCSHHAMGLYHKES